MSSKIPTNVIQQIVDESQCPVLFKNVLVNNNDENLWKLSDWNFEELSNKIGDVKLPFREGVNSKTEQPQWEYKCPTINFSMKEFLEIAKTEENPNWYYFDYKYMHEWFDDNSEIVNSVDWKSIGFDIDSKVSTIWIGSKGAHSNCHKDTYGKNLVAQIHGRKQWLLFPPTIQDFCETRDPYEESTVYTKLNFFTPGTDEINRLKSLKHTARIVILEPGDMLFVPHGWWHFVESLETSLSVNVWFPLKTDCYDRLSEALVKLFVNQLGRSIPIASETDKCDSSQCLNFVKQSLLECKTVQDSTDLNKPGTSSKPKTELENLLKKYSSCVQVLEEVPSKEYEDFLKARSSRFKNCENKLHSDEVSDKLESDVINAVCTTQIMQQIVEKLCSDYFD